MRRHPNPAPAASPPPPADVTARCSGRTAKDGRWPASTSLHRRGRVAGPTDLLQRRRPIGDAVDLLRLQLNQEWLDHRASGRLHAPADWDLVAGRVPPGAAISSLGPARGLHSRAPSWI
jgi:hypothetical protein